MPKEILALDLQKRKCFKEVLSKKKYGSKWLKNLLYNFPLFSIHYHLFSKIEPPKGVEPSTCYLRNPAGHQLMEPSMGLEPTACCLRNSCSTS